VFVVVAFLLALALRIAGMGWGLPTESRHQSLHPDEFLIAAYATEQPYFRPNFYNYGTLYLTLLKVASDAGIGYGWVPSGSNAESWQTLRGVNLTGRWLSAVASALTVAIVVLLLLSSTNVLGALIGGLSLLIAPGHVVHSRFQTADILAVLLIALAAYGTFRCASESAQSRLSIWAWTGVAAGLAAGTKYTGALLLLPLLFIALKSASEVRWARLSAVIGCFALGFILATPGVLLEFDSFKRDFLYEIAHTAEGHGLVFANTPSGFVYHVLTLVTAFGIVAFIAGVAGLLWATIRSEPWAVPFLLFVVAYYIVIGRAEVKFVRYVLPLLPFLAVGVGYLVARLHGMSTWQKVLNAVIVFAIGISVRAQTGVVPLTALMRGEDPRDSAARWLRAVAPDATVGFVTVPWFYSPPLFPDSGLLGADNRLLAMSEFDPSLVVAAMVTGARIEWNPALVELVKPEYIVFSSFEFIDHDRSGSADLARWFESAANEYRLEAVAWGGEVRVANAVGSDGKFDRDMIRGIVTERFPLLHDMMYIQPTICILKRRSP
jgi:hypothetical protein